jgi:hypothetical protein
LNFSPPLVSGPSDSGKKGGQQKGTKDVVSLTKSVGAWFDVAGEFAVEVFYRDVTSLLSKEGLKIQ